MRLPLCHKHRLKLSCHGNQTYFKQYPVIQLCNPPPTYVVLAYSNCALCIPSHKGWSTDVFCHTCTISPHIFFHGTTINPTWNTELFDKHLISYYELCFVKNSVVVLWDSLPRKTQQASVCTVSMVLYVGYHFRLYLWFVPIIVFMCMYRVQNVFLRCPTPRLHCFLSSHWPSFRFLSFMAFFIPSIQLFFGLPRALFCFSIHFSVILGSLLLYFMKIIATFTAYFEKYFGLWPAPSASSLQNLNKKNNFIISGNKSWSGL